MIGINPKEYFEKYKDFSVNKKHKRMKEKKQKKKTGMDFEVHLERLATLHKYCFDNKLKKYSKKDFRQ